MRNRIVKIAGYLFFLFCLMEGSARLAYSLPLTAKRLNDSDAATFRRKWKKRQQSGRKFYAKFDMFDPVRGWKSIPNYQNDSIWHGRLLINSEGMRAGKEYAIQKDSGQLRVMMLGDSFTFGEEVADRNTFSYILQKLLPQVEVINMGVHGYAHDQMLLFFKETGLKYKPDVVILGFVEIDMYRNMLSFRDFAKPKFELDGQGELRLTNVPLPSPEQVMKWDWARLRSLDLIRLAKHRWSISSGAYEKQKRELTEALIAEILKETKKIGAVPMIMYLPYGKEIKDTRDTVKYEQFLFDFCQKTPDVHCFSTRPGFKKKLAKGRNFNTKGHYKRLGHYTVAEVIKKQLTELGLIKQEQIGQSGG